MINKLSSNNNIVYWGCGVDNTYQETPIDLTFLENSKIAGIRDKNTKYELVPCASCLAQEFDKINNAKNNIEHKIIFYLHKDYSLKYIEYTKENSIPTITNKDNLTFADILNFLSKAEHIVTNSYHGLYWSTLLGKKVILLPWQDNKNNTFISNKFKNFPFDITICNDLDNLQSYINKTQSIKDALSISREKNIKFKEKVLNLINKH